MPPPKLPTTLAGLFKRAGDYKGANLWNQTRIRNDEYDRLVSKLGVIQNDMRHTQRMRYRHLTELLARVLPDQRVSFGARSPLIATADSAIRVVSCQYAGPRKGKTGALSFNGSLGEVLTFDGLVKTLGDGQALLDVLQHAIEKKLKAELTEALS